MLISFYFASPLRQNAVNVRFSIFVIENSRFKSIAQYVIKFLLRQGNFDVNSFIFIRVTVENASELNGKQELCKSFKEKSHSELL